MNAINDRQTGGKTGAIVAIARVKNEADIIEPFLRHTAAHVDRILLLDHASSDRTVPIAEALVGEGLPIEIESSTALRTQGEDMTRLMRVAVAQHDAAWIVPLDADEFIETPLGTTLKDRLPADGGKPLRIYWRNFAYRASDPTQSPVQGLDWRSTQPSELPKIIVPRSLAGDGAVEIYEGNHKVVRAGASVDSQALDGVILGHFPIRSRQQYMAKALIGTWRYIINHSVDGKPWGWHYSEDYRLIRESKFGELEARMEGSSLGYSDANQTIECIQQPLTYLGGPLRYATPALETDLIAQLANYADTIARELASSRDLLEGTRRKGLLAHIARRILRLPDQDDGSSARSSKSTMQ